MNSFRRVLIVHPYGIGDLLFTTPALRALRLVPSIERVDLLLGSRTESMIKSNPHVDQIYVMDKDHYHAQGKLKTFKEVISLGRTLKENQYDLLIDFSMRREHAFWGKWYLDIPVRVGFDYKKRGKSHTHTYSLEHGFKDRHVVEDYCDLVEKVGILVENRILELYVPDEAKQNAFKKNQEVSALLADEYISFAPGGGESWGKDASLKRWAPEKFVVFLNRLVEHTKIKNVVILGSEKEYKLGEKMKQGLQGSVLNLSGKMSLMESAAIIKDSQVFVGNDGGLVHIAHALRCPTIAFYGPASPKVYGAYPKTEQSVSIYQPENPEVPCYQTFRYDQQCRCLQELTPSNAWAQFEKTKLYSLIQQRGNALADANVS